MWRPDCPVLATDSPILDAEPKTGLVDQLFTSSEMGESMDADLLPELSSDTWVASALLEELTADLLPVGADLDLIVASRQDTTLATVREWIQSGYILVWAECAGLYPELRCWRLQVGNLSIDTDRRLWRAPMGHVAVGHHWERVAMDLLDLLIMSAKGNRYVLVMVDCFSRWTEASRLPDKTAISVADAFFSSIVCCFGMPSVINSDQSRELCLLGGSHKTKTTPYHPESDGLVERFNRTLLMMLAMLAGENKDDWGDLLPVVIMAYRSNVHASTGFSPYRLMFGEKCTLPMDIGLPRQQLYPPEGITSPYAVWVKDMLEVAFDQVRRHSGQVVQRQKRLYDQRAV